MKRRHTKTNPFDTSSYDLTTKPKVNELFLIKGKLSDFLIRLVYFIERNLSKEGETILLVRKEIEFDTKMTATSVQSAIDEAIERGFLIQKNRNLYWVNPELYFNLKK